MKLFFIIIFTLFAIENAGLAGYHLGRGDVGAAWTILGFCLLWIAGALLTAAFMKKDVI
jgi:hypothetical protein